MDKELKQAFKIYEELDMMICNTNDFIKIDQKFTEVKQMMKQTMFRAV